MAQIEEVKDNTIEKNWVISFGIPVKYNYKNNTVLLRTLDAKLYRVPLMWGGVFELPNPEKHILIFFHPSHIKELVSENSDEVNVGFAFLANIASFNWKLLPSTPVSFIKNEKGNAPLGSERVLSMKEGTGISVREDGTVVIQSEGATIVLGKNGIMMDGEITYGKHIDDNMGLIMKNPLTFLPSFVALPLPERIVNVGFVENLATKIQSLREMLNALINLIALVKVLK